MEKNRLLEAYELIESQSIETKIAHLSHLKVLIDEEARLADAREEGIEEGIRQVKERGLKLGIKEVAQNMIVKGKSNEEIMEVTDLALEEIEVLRTKMK